MPSARIVATIMAASAHDQQGLAGKRVEREAACHDQLAMREVDQAHDAEDEADAERRQRIDGAQADGIDGVLQEDHRRALPRANAEIGGIEGGGAVPAPPIVPDMAIAPEFST